MKTLLLSAAVAAAIGASALTPAAAQVTIQGPGYSDGGRDRDCRTVEKRVTRDGRTVVTRERQCDGDRRVSRDRNDRYVERRDGRRYDDRDDRPGINLNLGR